MAEFSVTTGRDGSRSFEHDDRWDNGGSRGRGRGGYRGNTRKFRGGRGSYRRGSGSYRGGSYRGGRDGNYGDNSYSSRGGPNPRSRLDGEGDDTMGDETEDKGQNRRFSPYGTVRPRGNTRWRRNENSNRPDSGGRGTYKRLGLPIDSRGSGDGEWYKIQIPWGKNAEKEFILKGINSRLDVPFIPTYFHHEEKSAVFYVNEKTTADAIRSISKKITMPNGYKMTILVKNSHPPCIPMGEAELDKLKHCMSARYDPPTKTLNLSSLHSDKVLSENQLYMSLARPQVMTNVVKIIKENIPELVGLVLSKNKLERLDTLAPLVSKTPDLIVLDLSDNKITHMEELRKLSTWKLEGLHLHGNSMCDKFSDRTSYVR